jgi:hypothetical protein
MKIINSSISQLVNYCNTVMTGLTRHLSQNKLSQRERHLVKPGVTAKSHYSLEYSFVNTLAIYK